MLVKTLVVLLVLAVLYLAFRAVRGFRLYLQLRGASLVTCPEIKRPAFVRLGSGAVALEAFFGDPCLRISECSRWPMRSGCGQDCLSQIKARADN